MKRAILAVVFLAACAHSERGASRVSARVMSYQSGAIQPLSGAQVSLQCPNGETRELGRTGADGRLAVDAAVAPTLDCNLIVVQSGYRPATFHVLDACQQSELGPCTSMDISAVLRRSGSAGDVR